MPVDPDRHSDHARGSRRRWLDATAALSLAIAVAAGAFGAHGAQSPIAADWLRTGGLYQMIHALGALMLAARHPRITATLLTGAAIFGGTLYAMALGAPRWFGAITPVGGALLIAGWLALAWVSLRRAA